MFYGCFFAGRELGRDLVVAVRFGLEYGRYHNLLFLGFA